MIEINEFFKYFQNSINDVVDELYDQGQLEEKPVIEYFYEKGDYIEKSELVYHEEEIQPILIRFSDKERYQDPSVAIEAYYQTINIELLCYKDGEHPLILSKIIKQFFQENKAKVDTINDEGIFINISRTNPFKEVSLGSADRLVSTLDVVCTVCPGATLSNYYKMEITSGNNNLTIFTDAISFDRQTELIADSIKQNDVKFFPNTSVFSLSISGLYSRNNLALRELLNDTTDNSKFGQYYIVNIKEVTSGESLQGFPKEMYCKSSHFDLVNSGLIKYSAVFCRGTVI